MSTSFEPGDIDGKLALLLLEMARFRLTHHCEDFDSDDSMNSDLDIDGHIYRLDLLVMDYSQRIGSSDGSSVVEWNNKGYCNRRACCRKER